MSSKKNTLLPLDGTDGMVGGRGKTHLGWGWGGVEWVANLISKSDIYLKIACDRALITLITLITLIARIALIALIALITLN